MYEEIVPTHCVNRHFPNLILFHFVLLRLHFRTFVNCFLNYAQKINLKNFKPLFPIILQIFDFECRGQAFL